MAQPAKRVAFPRWQSSMQMQDFVLGKWRVCSKNQPDFVYCVVVVVVCNMLQTWQVLAVNTSQQLATANTSVVDVCTFSFHVGLWLS